MMPTRKWWFATVTATGTEAVAIISDGWTQATQIALVGLVVQRLGAWLLPNDQTPGGVPRWPSSGPS